MRKIVVLVGGFVARWIFGIKEIEPFVIGKRMIGNDSCVIYYSDGTYEHYHR